MRIRTIIGLICLIAVPALAQNEVYQARRNSVSRIDFISTNYGTFGSRMDLRDYGVFWPRGSSHTYMFGGGLWFGAKKWRPVLKPDTLIGYLELSYHPATGRTWMVPGRIEEGNKVIPAYAARNRILSSSGFDSGGRSLDSSIHVPWPVWDTDYHKQLGSKNYFGSYVYDPIARDRSTFLKGPAFLSDEDIFSTWKDSDSSRIDDYRGRHRYPMPFHMQFEESIYTWKPGTTALEDILVIRYTAVNRSKDTLHECWIGWMSDVDILDTNGNNTLGAGNDYGRYLSEYDSLRAGAFWSGNTFGDTGKALGYLSICMLEGPGVDRNGFLRRGFVPESGQLGIGTYKAGSDIEEDLSIQQRYLKLSSGIKSTELLSADLRGILSTGPFHMLPGDTVRFAIGLVFAKPKFPEQQEKRGMTEDMEELVGKIVAARSWYNSDKDLPRDTIRISTEGNPLTVYPQPVSERAVANIFLPENMAFSVRIYDNLGRSTELYSGEGRKGENIIPLNVQAMGTGACFLEVNYSGKRIVSPLLILH